MSYQLNEAVFRWGDFIETLIHENSMRDKKGRRLHNHDIKSAMGITEREARETGWDLDLDSLSDMEVGDVSRPAEDSLSNWSIASAFREDGSVAVDVNPEGKARQRYRDPRELLKYHPEGEILRQPIKYEGHLAPENVTKANTPPDWDDRTTEKPDTPEDWTDSKLPPGADNRGHQGTKRFKRGGNFTVADNSKDIIWHE